jgi:hypothetical protein
MEDIEKIDNDQGCTQKKHNWQSRLPCWRFIIAAGLSLTSFTVGTTMLIISPPGAALVPFYSSLITGALTTWIDAPTYSGKPQKTLQN